MILAKFALILFALILHTKSTLGNQDPDLPPGTQRMSFKPPQLSDEEERSQHMPEYLACDACTAAANRIDNAFHQAHRHTKELKLWRVIEVLEETCRYRTFEVYGITEVDGLHRLKGPGLEAEGKGGVAQMGGKWPSRIVDMCLEVTGVYEDEEAEVYRVWREKGTLHDFFCKSTKRPLLDRCLKSVEQPELIRTDMDDMIKEMGEKERRGQGEKTKDKVQETAEVISEVIEEEDDIEKDEL